MTTQYPKNLKNIDSVTANELQDSIIAVESAIINAKPNAIKCSICSSIKMILFTNGRMFCADCFAESQTHPVYLTDYIFTPSDFRTICELTQLREEQNEVPKTTG